MGECLIIRSGGGTDTSGATATAARVLSGYTCYVNDVKITGTMANQGTKTASLNAGGSYTIPAGYHSGSGKVTANALSGQTSANATAARILSGKTAWVNGSKLTGTMTNRGAISQKLAANGSYTVPAGWHNGSGKVTQSLTTQGAKNVTPKTTNQTACAASRWTTGNIVIVGASTLTAGNIKKGVKIFNVTGTFTGWVDNSIVMFQNGTLVQNSNLGGTVTYNAGTWWESNESWFTGGGSWSQGTNIVLKLTTDCNMSSSRRMYHGARMQFGPVNTPTFKSFTLTYSWQFKQNWDDKRIMFCWGSESSLNDIQLQDRYTDYGYISSLDGAVASSGSKTVSFNLHNYTVNGSTNWFRYVDMKVHCQTPVYDTPNEATITITKITLNRSTV